MSKQEYDLPDLQLTDIVISQQPINTPGILYPSISSDYVINQQIEGIGVMKINKCAEDIDETPTEEIVLQPNIESDIYYEDMLHE